MAWPSLLLLLWSEADQDQWEGKGLLHFLSRNPSRKPQTSLSRSLETGTEARLKQSSGGTLLTIHNPGPPSKVLPPTVVPLVISQDSVTGMFTGQFDEGSTSAEVSSSLLSKLAGKISHYLAVFTAGHSWGSFVWILVHMNGFFIKAFSFTVSAILDPARPALLLQLKHVNVDAPGKVRTGLRKKTVFICTIHMWLSNVED